MEWTEDYTPSALDQIRSAQDADEKERRRREALAEIQQGIDMVVRRRTDVPRPQAQPFDKNLQAFLLSRKVGQEDQTAELARAKLEHETQGDLSGQPAPPEWGAIPGMTRKEALGAGYGKAPKPPDENEDELAPPEWHDKLRALGIPNPESVSKKFAQQLLLADVNRRGQAQAAIGAEGRKSERDAPKDAFDMAAKLRQEFMGHGTVKRSVEMSESNAKIQGTSPNGPGDISLLVAYMKMVDPGSTVRENEFATAENAGGVPEKVRNIYNKVREGDLLSDEVRRQFRAESAEMLKAQVQRYNSFAEQYRGLAKRHSVAPEDVVLQLGMVEDTRFKNGRVYQKIDGKWYNIGPEIK